MAVSAGCNARCVGCISKQDEEGLVSPQDRLTFVPTVDEIVEVGVAHLEQRRDAIYSFGQGCEGEPLLQWRLIEAAIRGDPRAHRARHDQHQHQRQQSTRAQAALRRWTRQPARQHHLGAPRDLRRLLSPHRLYASSDVKRSLALAREAGVYSSINLLCFPGLIDAEDEIEALVAFLRETGVRLVQLRNLNIDPEVLLPTRAHALRASRSASPR